MVAAAVKIPRGADRIPGVNVARGGIPTIIIITVRLVPSQYQPTPLLSKHRILPSVRLRVQEFLQRGEERRALTMAKRASAAYL